MIGIGVIGMVALLLIGVYFWLFGASKTGEDDGRV